MKKLRNIIIFAIFVVAYFVFMPNEYFAQSDWHDHLLQSGLLSESGSFPDRESLRHKTWADLTPAPARAQERLDFAIAQRRCRKAWCEPTPKIPCCWQYCDFTACNKTAPRDSAFTACSHHRQAYLVCMRNAERERRSRQSRWQPGREPGGIQDPDTGQSVPFTNCYCANETGMKDSCTEGCRLIEEKALSFEKCFWKCTDGKGTFYHINGDTGALMKKWTMGSSDN